MDDMKQSFKKLFNSGLIQKGQENDHELIQKRLELARTVTQLTAKQVIANQREEKNVS